MQFQDLSSWKSGMICYDSYILQAISRSQIKHQPIFLAIPTSTSHFVGNTRVCRPVAQRRQPARPICLRNISNLGASRRLEHRPGDRSCLDISIVDLYRCLLTCVYVKKIIYIYQKLHLCLCLHMRAYLIMHVT